MSQFKTEQEAFWAGEFGDAYVQRSQGDLLVAANIDMFSKALRVAQPVASCIEFGANVGLNLRALKALYPQMEQHAIEINADAVAQLQKVVPAGNIHHGSILEYEPARLFDLVLIKGVLIHINPEHLPAVYDKLYRSAGKYIIVCEYYNPTPVTVTYRGHENRLFKRDFAGELMDRFADVKLLDYGFVYRRDPKFPQDDGTWFLLEKTV
jgi:pseudaminic acid biosynthesis-associated methylase